MSRLPPAHSNTRGERSTRNQARVILLHNSSLRQFGNRFRGRNQFTRSNVANGSMGRNTGNRTERRHRSITGDTIRDQKTTTGAGAAINNGFSMLQ